MFNIILVTVRDIGYLEKKISGYMHRSRNFCQWGEVWAQLPENSFDNVLFFCFVFFSPQLILQFFRRCPMVISKKSITLQGFRKGPTFSRGEGPTFSRGVQMLISIETHVTCDFPGGSRPPIPPLDLRYLPVHNACLPDYFKGYCYPSSLNMPLK